MKASFLIIILATLILAASCDDSKTVNPTIQGWYEVADTIMVNIPQCLAYPYVYWENDTTLTRTDNDNDTTYKTEYIINDTIAYKELQKLDHFPCNLPYIDFSKYTLIGKYTIVGGSETPIIERIMTRNDELKKYHYQINITRMNMDDIPYYIGMSWITIPKIPYGYNVEFGVELSYN